MKKYITLAAVVAMMASCSNETLIDDAREDANPSEIGFSTFTNNLTKAENSTESSKDNLEAHHTTFKAWGAKVATTHQAVYAADAPAIVTHVAAAGENPEHWTADPIKFWDKAASQYYFYAAAPSTQNWALAYKATNDMSDATITLADFKLTGVNVTQTASTTATTSWQTNGGADVDLLIASPCPVAREAYNKPTADKVNLEFNHILSRLNILVKKGTNVASSKVSLTELKVYNMKNKGSFNEWPDGLNATALQAGTIARWATPTVDGTYLPAGIAVTSTAADNGVTTTAQYVLETLIIPQNVAYQAIDVAGYSTGTTALTTNDSPYIYIKYTVDGEEFYGYYNLAKAFGLTAAGNIAFNEGWQNNLTITINPNAIEFDAEVFNWEDQLSKEYEIPSETTK